MKTGALVPIIFLGILAVSCSSGPQETGTLEGRVTIGPIQPVVRPGEEPPVPPEVYEARKVMVYDRNQKRLIKQIDLGLDGHYSAVLPAGIYTIDINRIGIDSSSEVPKQVEIKPGETVVLNIDIDTGIR